MKHAYIDKKFQAESLSLITTADSIIRDYTRRGFRLTLRQLYYQMVAKDIIPNTVKSYKRLGGLINDGRMAGLLDWNAIEDRTRNLAQQPEWRSPSAIIDACASQYRIDRWDNQDHRPEIWVEKEALAGVIEVSANKWRVPYFCCRGYVSQSEMWGAAQRLARIAKTHTPVIIHLGDHDPSDIDMTRDIIDRLQLFVGEEIEVKRIALNMDQIEAYGPPPNPAKATDSRFESYAELHGEESWELDALDPDTIAELIDETIEPLCDTAQWNESEERETTERDLLVKAAAQWPHITSILTRKRRS